MTQDKIGYNRFSMKKRGCPRKQINSNEAQVRGALSEDTSRKLARAKLHMDAATKSQSPIEIIKHLEAVLDLRCLDNMDQRLEIADRIEQLKTA